MLIKGWIGFVKMYSRKKVKKLLEGCHASPNRGIHEGECTTHKVLQSGFFWPTLFKYFMAYIKECDQCQRLNTTFIRHEMPLINII